MKNVMASMTLLLVASAVAAAETTPMNDCARLAAAATRTGPGTYDVQAVLAWSCDSSLLGDGIAKFRVNGEPVGESFAFDGTSPLTFKTTVTTDIVPLKVCAVASGFDDAGEPTVSAQQCVNAVLVEAPSATEPLPSLRPGNRLGHVRR